MTDFEAEAIREKRVPRDDFEAELFRRHIQQELQSWHPHDSDVQFRVGDVHVDGVFGLYAWQDNQDPLQIVSPRGEARGNVWLAENGHPVSEYYRVEVWHEIDGPPNSGAPPVLRWLAG